MRLKRQLIMLSVGVSIALGGGLTACSSSPSSLMTDSKAVQLHATADVMSTTAGTSATSPQLRVTVTAKNTGDQTVSIRDSGCVIPISVALYRDAAHSKPVDWTYTDPQTCPMVLLAPSSLAPGETVTFAKIFSALPSGSYYGLATVWVDGSNKSIDLGLLTIP